MIDLNRLVRAAGIVLLAVGLLMVIEVAYRNGVRAGAAQCAPRETETARQAAAVTEALRAVRDELAKVQPR